MQHKIRLLFRSLCWQCFKTKSFTFGCRFQSKCGFFIPCSCWWTNAILFWFFICSNAYPLLPSTANAKKNWITVVSPWAALQNNCEHFYSTHVSDNTLFLNTFSMEKMHWFFLPRRAARTTIQDKIWMKFHLDCARTIVQSIGQTTGVFC